MSAPLLVTVVPSLGTPETGLWCEACNLPSMVRYPVTAVLPSGVLPLRDMHLCTEHQAVPDVVRAWHELLAERGLPQVWIPDPSRG